MLQKVADHGATNKIYACEVSRRDHLIRIKGGPFDAKEYDEYPSRYISVFSKKVEIRIQSLLIRLITIKLNDLLLVRLLPTLRWSSTEFIGLPTHRNS